MMTGKITKTGTFVTTLHKSTWKANPYVRFGYGLLKICNHNQGQVPGSMNTDPINMMQKANNQLYKDWTKTSKDILDQ